MSSIAQLSGMVNTFFGKNSYILCLYAGPSPRVRYRIVKKCNRFEITANQAGPYTVFIK